MTRPTYPCHVRNAMDWRQLADAHRPTDPQAIAREVQRLHAQHLSAVDISEALGLALPVVMEMIQRGQP